jgi:antitoxin (DNA-binding transcriptional repressor) of toxin-antitoxin stability system
MREEVDVLVDEHDAGPRLATLMHLARHGETVLIARNGRAVAKLLAFGDPPDHLERCDQCLRSADDVHELREEVEELRAELDSLRATRSGVT